MFLFRYLVLLLIPIYTSTNHCNQNEIFVDKKLHQRIKRLFNRRSSKFRVDSDTISKSNQRYDNLFLPSNDGEKSKLETKIKYIQQDLAEIKRILSKKEHDYYGILNIDKDATQDKIVTAHRKLTLIVHPDKINVSGATEATQRLNKARIVLLKTIEIQNQGGGFVFGDIDTYSGFECHLSKYQNMLIVHVELRHVPEYSLEEIIQNVIQAYQFLLNVDFNIHQRLIGMGDSSGGMLWIYLLQWIVSNNKPVSQGVVLHSPWSHLDFTEENLYDYRDNILSVQLAFNSRQVALGKTTYWFELTDEQVNKINPKRNAFEGFPSLYITAADGQVILDEGKGLMHTYPLFHMWIFKGKCIRQNVRKWIHVTLPIHMRSTLNMAEIETNLQNIREPGLCT
ncbi:unnamed protein product [Rotaria magnacalcarata]|uniref:J domain-containing protein n=1 Tax=Rotaria magnacalcarata TaxID=392030 RepID=A0A816YPQ3_9BILA|nr:unnamed protein product [Rotaria magnacalcarata]